MTRSTEAAPIAVLDIGKTNLKLLVASDDGWPLETLSIPNTANASDPYLSHDLAGLETWFLDALAKVSQRHAIGAVIATAHGCGAVLVDGDRPVLPMMDYDAVSPPAIDEAYRRIAPAYREVFCGIGAGAMRLAKQLLWQECAFPAEFARAKTYLTTAQFFALRLGGRAASEISQLAAQGHIWDLVRHEPSSVMRERGWAHLLPQRAPAGAVLGTVSAAVAKRTGLARSTEILCGVHDSNANLFRYKAAGMADASILSTGTWMIGFQRDLDPNKLDANSVMVLNIDVDGENVPSTLTMTGREYDLIRKEKVLPTPLSLPRCRNSSRGGPWRCPPSSAMMGCSPVPLIAAGSSVQRPKRPRNGRGWRCSTRHSAQTAASIRLAVRNASSSMAALPPTCPSRALLPPCGHRRRFR